MNYDFQKVFYPESIALVGASNNLLKWGSFLLSHLTGGGYPRENIFPVNSREERIHDMPAYASLADLPRPADLVVVTTPARAVPSVLEECAQYGMTNIIVISSGFSEAGGEGVGLEQEITRIAADKGLCLFGPNTMGIVNTAVDMYALGAPLQLRKGRISFVSQSGNVGAQLLGWTMSQGIGFGKFIGTGNEASIHCEDVIAYFAEDPDTELVLAYIEGLENGHVFVERCIRASERKPVIVLKSGRTEAGSRAAMSHTGSLAGSDDIYDAAFRQSGVIRADSSQEMLDLAKSFGRIPLPRGNRMGILTLGGGWGVIATDAAVDAGFVLPPLDEETTRICDELLPPFWSRGNPIDLVGNLSVDIHMQILEKMAASPNFDAIVALGSLGTSVMIGMSSMVAQKETMGWDQDFFKSFLVNIGDRNRLFMDRAIDLMQNHNKPIVFVEMQFLGDDSLVDLEQDRSVIFTAPEKAAAVLHKMRVYCEWLNRAGG
jgi:acyl-CoA synthetase (NDP forming)